MNDDIWFFSSWKLLYTKPVRVLSSCSLQVYEDFLLSPPLKLSIPAHNRFLSFNLLKFSLRHELHRGLQSSRGWCGPCGSHSFCMRHIIHYMMALLSICNASNEDLPGGTRLGFFYYLYLMALLSICNYYGCVFNMPDMIKFLSSLELPYHVPLRPSFRC